MTEPSVAVAVKAGAGSPGWSASVGVFGMGLTTKTRRREGKRSGPSRKEGASARTGDAPWPMFGGAGFLRAFPPSLSAHAFAARLARQSSMSIGRQDTKMMPMTTSSKCFFTAGMFPKKYPAGRINPTHRKVDTTL